MSIKEIEAKLYECICVLPGCPCMGKPWTALKPPVLCRWCRRRDWDGRERRKRGRPSKLSTPLLQRPKEEQRAYFRNAQAAHRKKKKGNSGQPAANSGQQKPEVSLKADGCELIAAPLIADQKNRPAHAPGCPCTLCRLKQERKTGSKRVMGETVKK